MSSSHSRSPHHHTTDPTETRSLNCSGHSFNQLSNASNHTLQPDLVQLQLKSDKKRNPAASTDTHQPATVERRLRPKVDSDCRLRERNSRNIKNETKLRRIFFCWDRTTIRLHLGALTISEVCKGGKRPCGLYTLRALIRCSEGLSNYSWFE